MLTSAQIQEIKEILEQARSSEGVKLKLAVYKIQEILMSVSFAPGDFYRMGTDLLELYSLLCEAQEVKEDLDFTPLKGMIEKRLWANIMREKG